MSRVFKIAAREFSSTALTKGFLFGALVFPALIFAALPLIGRLIEKAEREAPVVQGRLVLLDRSGSGPALADRVALRLDAEEPDAAVPTSFADAARAAQEAADAGTAANPADALAALAGRRSQISLEQAAADADAAALRDTLRAAYDESRTDDVLAVAIVAPDAVRAGDDGFGGYELVHRRKLDDRVVGRMRGAVEAAIRDLRYEAAGLDRQRLATLARVPRSVQEVTESGDVQGSTAKFGIIMPFVMLILLIMAVMSGGQYLLTTTVEEKSSRVVEVLLSAVSPMQLMFGKILGQMGVGLALLAIYTGLGLAAAAVFGLAKGLISPATVALLAVYFFLGYVTVASFMAAVGAAVNEMREAQAMMMPVALLIMVPYLLVFPISRDPDSTLATVLSFIPPINPFVMVIRLGSTSPPPLWQHGLSIAVGIVGAWCTVWFAAKVFRVGLLMYGKPPNLKTLIRWVRMA
jgi:ABC-type Na+ efflux pump permease subunit